MKRNKKWLIAIVLLNYSFLLFPAIANMNLTRFPGERSEITSPNGRYILYNINTEKAKPYHTLFLKDLKKKTDEKLYTYDRYIEVLWSPKGTALIVNDHGGSDYTNSIIFLLNDWKKKIDVKEQIRLRMGNNKSIFGNHHVYIEGIEWIDENNIKIKIYGYGEVDPDGFTLWYEYKIGEGFQKLN